MVEFAQKYLDELPTRVDEVESSYRYFKENNQRYEEARTFLFKTTITEELKNTLVNINWPIFEFNILESFVSRLAGEFAKQIPSPSVRSTVQRNNDPKTAALAELLEGRLRYIFDQPDVDNSEKSIFLESVSGGFSAAKLRLDYTNPKSFIQDVFLEKCYDPTLCYFDPIARKNHKGDGRYCGELIPFTDKEFEQEWPDININTIEFSRDALTAGNLHWYYTEGEDSSIRKIIYVADHYVKKEVKAKLVKIKLPNFKPFLQRLMQLAHQLIMSRSKDPNSQIPPGSPIPPPPPHDPNEKMQPFIYKSMTEEEYEAFIEVWKSKTSLPVPAIIDERETMLTEIWHYRFIKDRLLERPRKTLWTILPIVFFDGNSHVIANKQMTRPYHYQAMDAQKTKNITGIAMMNAIENTPQTRLIMAKESIPEEPAYQETLKSPQRPAAAIVFNSMGETNDGKPLPPPAPLNFQYFGSELIQLFSDFDKTIQMILGNFDQQLGIQQKELSGIAIQEAMSQSNNAAMPYINNYMDSMNQISKGIIEVYPKIIRTERTLPIIDKNGLHQAIIVNSDQDNDLFTMDYDAMDMEVVVRSSVNFEIQKEKTFENFVSLMSLPDPNGWKGFFGGPAATDLLDNMNVRNQDSLKQKFLQYQTVQQQQEQQNKQMAMLSNPGMVSLQETQINAQLKQQQMQMDAMIKQQEMKIEEMNLKMDQQVEGMKMIQSMIESMAKIRESSDKVAIEQSKIEAENNRTASESQAMALEAALNIDRHLGDQMDRQAEHLYRQIELGNQLRETDLKHQSLESKNEQVNNEE